MALPDSSFRDKISYLDEFGQRKEIIVAEVKGIWSKRRGAVHAVLMMIFLILPWIKWNGDQFFLLDIAHRKFTIFGVRFWSHDAPLFFLLIFSSAIALALVTALVGRVWCGWACPQTVFLDGYIRKIERWVEGGHLERRALDREDFSFRKLRLKLTKWTLYVGFVFLLTHSFLAYFVGSDRLLEMVTSPPAENPWNFLFIMAISALLLADLTWFREQFCLIVCPYGRLQSLFHDRDTVTVQYNKQRSDCISCNKCVQVCPTGIDIRNGLQMECIACTACIDACDQIMDKVKKPRGLIAYRPTHDRPPRYLRSRILLYVTLLTLSFGALVTALAMRSPLSMSVLRSKEIPFYLSDTVDGKAVNNAYRFHVHNESTGVMSLSVQLIESEYGDSVRLGGISDSIELKPDEFKMLPFSIQVPLESFKKLRGTKLPLRVRAQVSNSNSESEWLEKKIEVDLVGPLY